MTTNESILFDETEYLAIVQLPFTLEIQQKIRFLGSAFGLSAHNTLTLALKFALNSNLEPTNAGVAPMQRVQVFNLEIGPKYYEQLRGRNASDYALAGINTLYEKLS